MPTNQQYLEDLRSRHREQIEWLRPAIEKAAEDSYFRYLGQLALAVLNDDPVDDLPPVVSFAQYSEHHVLTSHYVLNHMVEFSRDETLTGSPADKALNVIRATLESGIQSLMWDVDDGLPLYAKDPEGAFIPAGPEHSEAMMVTLMRKHYVNFSMESFMPDWCKAVYFSPEERTAAGGFFADTPFGEEHAQRLAAFQWHLKQRGLPEGVKSRAVASAMQHHKTRLLSLVDEVSARYYGSNYDPSNPDTLTPQKAVIDWLMAEFGLSKREAEAVDIVTRPDAARNKR